MRRATIPALVVVIGLLLLGDFLVVNDSLGELAAIAVDAAILVAAGAALAAVASLALRRARDLWQRRGDPIGASLVLVGIAAMLIAGLRPGSTGTGDAAVAWLVAALLVPIAATLFGLLFLTTTTATARVVAGRSREGTVIAAAAVVALVLLLPLDGVAGDWLAGVADWSLDVPIGAVLRGLLIGVGILGAILAARTLLGVGSADE